MPMLPTLSTTRVTLTPPNVRTGAVVAGMVVAFMFSGSFGCEEWWNDWLCGPCRSQRPASSAALRRDSPVRAYPHEGEAS